jgi:hypothetical protein
MKEAFGVDGRRYACAICGVYGEAERDGDVYVGPIEHIDSQCVPPKCVCWCLICERHNAARPGLKEMTPTEALSEPTFDADGYPTDATLDRIRTWPVVALADMVACMDFAGRAWQYEDVWTKEDDWEDPDWPESRKVRYVFSTVGWSGNESVVSAIERNPMLQMMGAWSWRRGGHYEYRFPVPTDG